MEWDHLVVAYKSNTMTFVFVCAHLGWVYRWTAQAEVMMCKYMSNRARKGETKAKVRPAPAACRHPSPRGGGKARGGISLLELLRLHFYSSAPLSDINLRALLILHPVLETFSLSSSFLTGRLLEPCSRFLSFCLCLLSFR